jgi:hypothetical protein
MTGSDRRKLGRAAAALGLVAGALLPIAFARAEATTLQVTREVNTALGGSSVPLTARLSSALAGVQVKFRIVPPAPPGVTLSANNCTTAADGTCQVTVNGTQLRTALIRAWVNGTTEDTAEQRAANAEKDLGLGLNPGADCRPEDDDLLTNSCSGAAANAFGSQAEPDGTDVVEVTFSTFVDGHLDCDDAHANDGEDTQYNNKDVAGSRTETYGCRLTDTAGAPIAGAKIDAAWLSGAQGGNAALMNPALPDDFCTTDVDGRCGGTITLGGAATDTGNAFVCFWGDGDGDAEFSATGSAVDGGGCSEAVDAAEDKDLTDTVKLNVDVPKPTSLDVQPDTQAASPGSTFRFSAIVFDQFGNPVDGNAAYTVKAELFQGSPLDGNDGNTPAAPDITKSCTGPTCPLDTRIQSALGANLACVWISGTPELIGDNLGGSCDNEGLADASFEDQVPSPVGDDRDVVSFAVRSRPLIATNSPTSLRQDSSNTATLTVEGFNFMSGARISLSGSGVTLGSTRFVSDKMLKTDITVPMGAPSGPRDITVTNPDGGAATCSGCFRVIGHGYWLVASDGGIFGFGDARFHGSPASRGVNSPVVAMATTPSGEGYWVASSDGGVFAQGDAPFLGSAGSLGINKPIVGMAATPTGQGYWLVASDGGIFAFGDARFYGSTGKIGLNKPIVGMTATPNGGGYWLVASDGGIFAFGNARFFGSTGDIRLNQPIVAMAPTKSGRGYWLTASDGGIFAFGDATFFGSTGDMKLNRPIVGMTTTPLVQGYWLVASDGGIFAFGDAGFVGSTGDIKLNRPIVGMARR